MADRLTGTMGTVYPYNESRVRDGAQTVALFLAQALAHCPGIEPFMPHMLRARHFQGMVGAHQRWVGPIVARKSSDRAEAIVSTAGGDIPSDREVLRQHKAIHHIFNPTADGFFQLEDQRGPPAGILWVSRNSAQEPAQIGRSLCDGSSRRARGSIAPGLGRSGRNVPSACQGSRRCPWDRSCGDH
jgi:hypothetical protein